jgi:uncharacterized protein (DUF2267 family)
MPMPYTYRHASAEFSAFLTDAREDLGLVSDNMAYTATDAVFQVFRARLTVPQALAFADVLPCVLRAIFLWRWSPAPPLPWADRATLAREAQAIRPHHNLTPDHAIAVLARVLRRHVLAQDLDRVLAGLPPGAAEFWHVPPDEAAGLSVRFP